MLRWELLSHSTFPFDLPVCPVQKRDDLGEWPRTTIYLFQMYLLFQMWYLSWRKKKKKITQLLTPYTAGVLATTRSLL